MQLGCHGERFRMMRSSRPRHTNWTSRRRCAPVNAGRRRVRAVTVVASAQGLPQTLLVTLLVICNRTNFAAIGSLTTTVRPEFLRPTAS